MTALTVLLPVEMTEAGVAQAGESLRELERFIGAGPVDGSASAAAGSGAATLKPADIVTVYEHARTVPDSHTFELLELFAREDLLTPEEIGVELGRGTPFNKRQGRAFVRNLSRMQKGLLAKGRIDRPVLLKNFDDYDRERAGRFGLSDDDRAALRAYLAA